MKQTTKMFYSVREFAALTNYHPDTVRRMITAGKIQGQKLNSGKILIPAKEIERLQFK